MSRQGVIIFDVEGTLIDCIPSTIESWQTVLATHGHAFGYEALHGYSGMDPSRMLRALLPKATKLEVEGLTKEQGAHYRKLHLPHVRPFPGVERLFADLAPRARLALATSCARDELDVYLGRMPIAHYVGAFVCGNDVEAGKPAPDLLAAASAALGVTKSECVFAVGDTPYDAEAAQAVGAIAIATEGGLFTKAALLSAGFEAVAGDLAELSLLLQSRIGTATERNA
jgi:phosphoglycolate phosphatase-like HAD superfamily hydrolase